MQAPPVFGMRSTRFLFQSNRPCTNALTGTVIPSSARNLSPQPQGKIPRSSRNDRLTGWGAGVSGVVIPSSARNLIPQPQGKIPRSSRNDQLTGWGARVSGVVIPSSARNLIPQPQGNIPRSSRNDRLEGQACPALSFRAARGICLNRFLTYS